MDNSFFSKFTPKEPKFFPLLDSLAEVSHKSAEQLITCVKDNKPEILQRIRDLEHEGDRVIEKVYYELNDTFITPFDREDINSLANGIDDVTDQIYGCAKRITFYKPKQIPRAAEEIAQMVLEGTQYMHKAIGELHSLKKKAGEIEKYCNKLHEIESQADEVFQNFTIELFENYTDAIEIIKLKEIVNVLEGITDEIDHIGKTIKIIIVKYV